MGKKQMNFLVVFLLVIIIVFFFISSPKEDLSFITGITVHHQRMDGLTKEEATLIFSNFVQQVLRQELLLITPDAQVLYLTSLEGCGVEINYLEAIEQALHIGNEGLIIERIFDRVKTKVIGKSIMLDLKLNKKKAKEEIKRVSADLTVDPVNACLVIENNIVSIQSDHEGLELDLEKVIQSLESNLNFQGPIIAKIFLRPKIANITKKDLEQLKINAYLGGYTTYFDAGQTNRYGNIRLAALALDNHLIPPDKEFSFNKTVGPRTKDLGYNEGTVIQNREMVTGIGGGVCQVSSTLYNAILKANLQVTERHPHSISISYVPEGMDAAVAYHLKDLKFINNTEAYLLIKTFVAPGSITIKIFGYQKPN